MFRWFLNHGALKMEIKEYRKCGECHKENIPFGIDWLWWKDGSPLCLGCAVKLRSSDLTENPAIGPGSRTILARDL